VCRFPDRTVGVLDAFGFMDGSFVITEVDFGKRVEVTRERFPCIEFFGLVDYETDNTDVYAMMFSSAKKRPVNDSLVSGISSCPSGLRTG